MMRYAQKIAKLVSYCGKGSASVLSCTCTPNYLVYHIFLRLATILHVSSYLYYALSHDIIRNIVSPNYPELRQWVKTSTASIVCMRFCVFDSSWCWITSPWHPLWAQFPHLCIRRRNIYPKIPKELVANETVTKTTSSGNVPRHGPRRCIANLSFHLQDLTLPSPNVSI